MTQQTQAKVLRERSKDERRHQKRAAKKARKRAKQREAALLNAVLQQPQIFV